MSAAPLAIPAERRLPAGAIRVVAFIAVVLLAYEALHFYWRDPRHYLLDYSQKSFADYWPNRTWLVVHITGATIALVAGPFQLWSGIRRRPLRWHRVTGYLYLGGVAIGGIGAFRLAAVTTAADKGVSLFVFVAAWWTSIAMAYTAIRRRRIDAHKEWMIRGYVLTYAFVTIRWIGDLPVWDPLGPAGIPTQNWLGWVVPLFVTEVILQWRRTLGPVVQ